jgi:acid phosphatase family membrane protein YuiD
LNVKYVRLSCVIALAPLAIAKTSTTNTEAEANLFNMLVLLHALGIRMRAGTSAAVEGVRG